MIKGVCFDLDGVFFTKKGMQSVKEELIKMSGNEANVIKVLFTSDTMKSFKKGEISEEDYLSYLNEELGTAFDLDQLKVLIAKEYEINTDVLTFMNHLRASGIKTLACSNNFATRVNALEERFDFLHYFDTALFSFQVRELKPASAIFKALIDASGLNGNEIVYTDDLAEGLVHASELGIKTHQFESFETYKKWIVSIEPTLA